MKSGKRKTRHPIFILGSILIGMVFIGGLALLFSCYAMDIKAEAIRLGILKKKNR